MSALCCCVFSRLPAQRTKPSGTQTRRISTDCIPAKALVDGTRRACSRLFHSATHSQGFQWEDANHAERLLTSSVSGTAGLRADSGSRDHSFCQVAAKNQSFVSEAAPNIRHSCCASSLGAGAGLSAFNLSAAKRCFIELTTPAVPKWRYRTRAVVMSCQKDFSRAVFQERPESRRQWLWGATCFQVAA